MENTAIELQDKQEIQHVTVKNHLRLSSVLKGLRVSTYLTAKGTRSLGFFVMLKVGHVPWGCWGRSQTPAGPMHNAPDRFQQPGTVLSHHPGSVRVVIYSKHTFKFTKISNFVQTMQCHWPGESRHLSKKELWIEINILSLWYNIKKIAFIEMQTESWLDWARVQTKGHAVNSRIVYQSELHLGLEHSSRYYVTVRNVW